jgi:hypothetical protein
VEEVRRARELEGLDVRKPIEKELAPLGEGSSAVLTDHGEYGLGDAPRVLLRERPALPHRRQLLGKERVCVTDRLVGGAGEFLLERAPVVGAEDAAEERVDRACLVAAR